MEVGGRRGEGGGEKRVHMYINFQDTTHRQQSIGIYTPSTQSTLTLSTLTSAAICRGVKPCAFSCPRHSYHTPVMPADTHFVFVFSANVCMEKSVTI